MKLSDLIEVFKRHDKVLFKLTGIGETEYDTIEFKDAIDTIEALQAENEQLRARVVQYREALIIANHRMPDVEAFSDTLADYHNPADVELLRKARKALHKGISALKVHCKYFDQTPEEDACIEMREAAVEIDKAIGGEEG